MHLHLLLLTIGLTLVPAGYGLSCYQCDENTCTLGQVSTQTCPNKKGQSAVCAVLTYSTSVKQSAYKTYNVKTCEVRNDCRNGSMNLGDIAMYEKMDCCTSDMCNKVYPALSIPKPNGMTCYTCHNSTSCEKSLPKLECRGEQETCLKMVVTSGGKTAYYKGCGTETMCPMEGQGVGITGTYLETILLKLVPAPGMSSKYDIHCCTGHLCNGANGVQAAGGLLMLLAPVAFFCSWR